MKIEVTWPVGGPTGWGVCGVGLVGSWLRAGHRVAVSGGVKGEGLAPWDLARFRPLLTQQMREPEVRVVAVGNGLAGSPMPRAGDTGLVFLEDTTKPEGVPSGVTWVAGSTWCRDVLRGWGLEAGVFRQGVDPAIFCPGPRPRLFPDHWPVVFSGGKLEYRKGQDIVVAAFREILQRYPRALLLTAWGNLWPQTVRGIEAAGHVGSVPRETSPMGLTVWLASEGIPAGHHHDIGMVSSLSLAYYLRAVDVAVFPNRCEGGTNLVAQECLSVGVPTILSRGTGHLDLIEAPSASFVKGAGIDRPPAPWRGAAGWVECDPAKVVEAVADQLESPYLSRVPWHLDWDDAARAILDHATVGVA